MSQQQPTGQCAHGAGCKENQITDDEGAKNRVIDPVCGMSVDPDAGKATQHFQGETFYFCSDRCKDKFASDPITYTTSTFAERQAAAAKRANEKPGTRYTCPMDPEVIQDEPGSCPICGMALEPMDPAITSDTENPELKDFSWRLVIGTLFAVPLVSIAMAPHIGLPLHNLVSPRHTQLLELALVLPIISWSGWPVFSRGWRSLLTGKLNMWTLIALGVGAALLYSVVAVMWPDVFPESQKNSHGVVGLYFESAAVIIVLVLAGQVLELKARGKTREAISALSNLSPKTVRRIAEGGTETLVPLSEVNVGDVLRIRPGEAVPTDGIIIEGQSPINETLLTGESIPALKSLGDDITGGTLNTSGSFVMKATRVGRDTMLAQIISQVATAQRSRAPIQSMVDRVASWFVPLVIAVAVTAFFAWLVFGPQPSLSHALVAAVGVLIIACPCALGLATPMSIVVGMGRGAHQGILVRDAAALEHLAKVDTLVIDKTGTLTIGRPDVREILASGDYSDVLVLKMAASLERSSEHPLASAIERAARDRNISIDAAQDVVAHPGLGVTGVVNGHTVSVGNAAFLSDKTEGRGVSMPNSVEPTRFEGATSVHVAIDGNYAGTIVLSDQVKPDAAAAIADLKAQGKQIIIASGDQDEAVRHVAHVLDIADARSAMTPNSKGELVKELMMDGRSVAFAGDGINDAPALATARVGIAMGTGADVAIDAADITLPKGDLAALVRACGLATATMTNIRQNLAFAFGYNAVGVPIAAGVLYPFFSIALSPTIAALAMSLSSVSVIANALRLNRVSIS